MQDPQVFSEDVNPQLTINSYRSLLHAAPVHPYTHTPNIKPRRSRAKRHRAWEALDRESDGIYSAHLQELAARFPMLSPMELMIGALIKGMMQSHEICEKLSIELKTVENHRNHIRKKLGLTAENLVCYLVGS